MTTQLASLPRAIRRTNIVGLVVTGLFSAATMAIAVPALRVPASVQQITIDNPHAWEVHIDVTDSDRDGWMGVGAVERENERTFQTVIDQGDTWVFDFAYSGEHTELRVSRHQLEQDDWRITVPDDFADRLRSADVTETPP